MSPLLCDRSSPEQTRICLLFQIPGCPHRPTQVKQPSSPLWPSQRPDNSPTSSNLILTITLLTWCRAHSCIGTFKKRDWGSEWSGVGCSGLPSSKAELRWNQADCSLKLNSSSPTTLLKKWALGKVSVRCACCWPSPRARGPVSFVARGQKCKLWCRGRGRGPAAGKVRNVGPQLG